MSKRKKEQIRKILGKAGVEKAPSDFTQQVMQDIFVSSSEEALKDNRLAALLKEPDLEMPSNGFVSNIMKDIEVQQNLEYKPLISKKAWFTIGGILVGIIVFVLFKDAPQEPSAVLAKVLPYLEETKNVFNNPFAGKEFLRAPELSPILAISLLCLSCMLFFDGIFKKKLFA